MLSAFRSNPVSTSRDESGFIVRLFQANVAIPIRAIELNSRTRGVVITVGTKSCARSTLVEYMVSQRRG